MAVIAYVTNAMKPRSIHLGRFLLKDITSRNLSKCREIAKIRHTLKNSSLNISRKITNASSDSPDYYTTLGVSRSADLKEIKLAYFNLAKKFHPDTNKSEEAQFMFNFIWFIGF